MTNHTKRLEKLEAIVDLDNEEKTYYLVIPADASEAEAKKIIEEGARRKLKIYAGCISPNDWDD